MKSKTEPNYVLYPHARAEGIPERPLGEDAGVITLYECPRCRTFSSATGGSCLDCGALNVAKAQDWINESLQKAAKRMTKEVVDDARNAKGYPAVQLIGQLIYQILKGKV